MSLMVFNEQVFTGNKETCLKILPRQVQKIMSLAATHTKAVPQFLDLLNSIVKVTFTIMSAA